MVVRGHLQTTAADLKSLFIITALPVTASDQGKAMNDVCTVPGLPGKGLGPLKITDRLVEPALGEYRKPQVIPGNGDKILIIRTPEPVQGLTGLLFSQDKIIEIIYGIGSLTGQG